MVKLDGFKCEDCRPLTDGKYKDCPGCGVAVEKTSGCNHITCPCGTHWCFVCRHVSDAHAIYGHMYKEHGGSGIDYAFDEEEEDMDEEDDY